jgi:hypothetical protein
LQYAEFTVLMKRSIVRQRGKWSLMLRVYACQA